jgi:hypothetical protein
LIAGIEVDPWLVPVRNISKGGINLILSQRITPGQVFPVRLFHTGRSFECRIPVRFLYCLDHSDGDYLVGGAFTRPLEPHEVESLL